MPVLIERNMRGSVIKLARKLDIHNYGHLVIVRAR